MWDVSINMLLSLRRNAIVEMLSHAFPWPSQ